MSNRVDQELSRVMTALSDTAPSKPDISITPKPSRRWGRKRRLVLGLATGGFMAISVVAVAQFTSDDPCNPPAGEVPGAACAEVAIPATLDDIEATGSDFEIAIAADGIVTRDELDSAADATVTCATDAGIANVEAYNPSQIDKSILESIYGIFADDPEDGYGFRMSVGDDPDAEEAAFESCEAQYMDQIATLWHYQQVVANR